MRETRQDLGAYPTLAICEAIAMGYKVQPEGRPQAGVLQPCRFRTERVERPAPTFSEPRSRPFLQGRFRNTGRHGEPA